MPKKKGELTQAVKTFGVRLKYARESRRMSQTELAELSGVDQGQISKYERQKRMGLEADTAVRLAHALEVPVGWLLAAEGDALGLPDEEK